MKNCTYVLRTVLICVFTVAGMLPGYSQQVEKGLNSSTGDYLGFLEYKPADYSSNTTTKYPLIIFLHGIGERGNGTTMLQDVTCCGIPRMIRLGHKMKFTWNGKTETFLVISPQCPEKYGMWPAVFITELINYAKNNLRIDPNRIYLTGLSMGGGGTLRFISTAAEQPKQLAAVAPICSPCTFSNPIYPTDAHLPFWGFHAADDAIASASCTEYAAKRMNDLNANPKPLLTIWPTGGHIVWDRVYTDTAYKFDGVLNVYEWFLAQNKTLPVNILPVARAGNTINITTGTATARLDASASTDADGRLVRYVWKKISGPTAGVITTPFGINSSTTVTGLTTAGTYQYQLNVVDDRAAVSRDTLTIVVSSGASVTNIAPVAKAGADANITLPTSTYTLNGSGSSDQDGTIKSYLWTKVSGPAVTIVNAAGVSTGLTGLVQGTYVFKLKVTDDKGATGEDQVTILVNAAPNVAPVAKAGADITITLPTNTVTVNGSSSTDSDGTISSYLWTKVSGPAATIANASGSSTAINNLVEGTYVFKLKVTDNDGASSEDQVTVRVNPAPNKLPEARAGSDITITLPNNRTSVSGVLSTDPDGTIATYAWAKLSGPSQFIIADPAAALTSITNLVEGTYTFRLVVTDNDGGTDADTIIIKVNPAPPPPNIAPVAQAGENQTITLPIDNITLNGTGSTDQDGTIEFYTWTYLNGPATYILNNAESATASVTGIVAGTYTFKLEVTDNDGAKDADTVSITVKEETAPPPPPNVVPVADAGNDIVITLPVNQVTLNGEGSVDADGTITNYSWKKISGPSSFNIVSATSSLTIIENLVEGTYAFRLQIKDNNGALSSDTVKVIVNPAPNETPASDAGPDMQVQLPDPDIQLNGTDSYDPDGNIAAYKWEQVSGPNTATIASTSSATTAVTGVIEGAYVFRLTVTDNDDTRASDVVKITVLAAPIPNVGPVANAGSDIQIILPDEAVQLNGGGSSDVDGSIVSYNWVKVSGAAGATISDAGIANPNVSGLIAGEYIFRLTVKDDDGEEASDEVRVTVHAPEIPNAGPVADAGNDVEVTLPNATIQLDGSNSSDADGTIVSYSWVKVSGPGATITNSTGTTPEIVGVEEGEYIFRLTIRDNDGEEASDEVKVIVHAAPAPPPPAVNEMPVADAGADQTISYPDTSLTISGTNSSDNDGTIANYEWTMLEGPTTATIMNPSSPSTLINNLQTGEYQFVLTVVDNKGGVARDTVEVSVINTQRFTEEFKVYPNPARSEVKVQMTSDTLGATRITIYNASGMIVQSIDVEKVQPQLLRSVNVSNLQTGIYYLEVIVDGKVRKITKFMKQ
jgi:poly(3-hydroxybutyrate) depolymerase